MELLHSCPVCGSESFDPYLSAKDYFLTGESFEIVKCRNCGLRFTNPRPGPAELGKYYQSEDYLSHSDSQQGLFPSVYQKVRKFTLWQKYKLISKFNQKGEILDIGCATGQFLKYMNGRGWSTTGIEPDEKSRTRAISEFGLSVFAEDHLNVFRKASFDLITMWHVLEHVSDLNSRIKQVRNLLKPGGTFILAVPNCDAPDAKIYGEYWAGYDLPRHLYHFTKTDIKLLMENFGFTIVTILPMRFDAFYVSLLSEKYKNGKMRWMPALWNGFWSNIKSGQNRGHSSLIYVVKIK